MASNKVPRNKGQLIGLGVKMEAGMQKAGPSVPVTMVTETQVSDDLNALIVTEDAFNAARSAAKAGSDVYQAALVAAYEWLTAARLVLLPKLGRRWSTAWAQAGFINGSTAIPQRVEERLSLVLALSTFFQNNPTYEVASLGVTAAIATTRRNAAITAQSAWADAEMLQKDTFEARTTACNTLVETMRTLIGNLDKKLGPLDPRWLAFGLNQPGMNQTPGKPVNVAAHTDGSGVIIVTCDPVTLAMRYRWRMLLVGVQTDYILAARSVDPMGMIKDVVPGQRVQLIVQAVNGAAQGVASDPIEFTMPLNAEMKAPETAAPKLEQATTATGATGNGNGHANGNRMPALG